MKPKASSSEAKARELVRHIDVVRAGAHRADKKNPATCTLLSMPEATVLGALAERGELPMSALAGAVNLSVSSATGLMDRLEDKGLARRVRSGTDRRMVRAELTAQGRRLAELVLEGRLRMTRRMLSALSPREQDAFVALFRKIAAALSKEAA
ncbi:MarR family transcriptional regulator [bacterium]|nr:MAG: MarR family transcriptional regulator [bacterium]